MEIHIGLLLRFVIFLFDAAYYKLFLHLKFEMSFVWVIVSIRVFKKEFKKVFSCKKKTHIA